MDTSKKVASHVGFHHVMVHQPFLDACQTCQTYPTVRLQFPKLVYAVYTWRTPGFALDTHETRITSKPGIQYYK